MLRAFGWLALLARSDRAKDAEIQYHLGKVFTKLAISSRSQLDRVLPGDRDTARPR